MRTKLVSFRCAADKVAALDKIAARQKVDRSVVINEAIDQYLSLYEYHRKIIAESLAELEAGTAKTIPHDEVIRRMAKLTKKRKKKLNSRRLDAGIHGH